MEGYTGDFGDLNFNEEAKSQKVDKVKSKERLSNGKKLWTLKEDDMLLDLAKKYENEVFKWKTIANYFPKKNFKQCYARFKMIDPIINKGQWSAEENQKLIDLANKYHNNYSKIAKLMGTRSAKQIRHHLLNVTLKNKEKFSKAEDDIIVNYFIKYGPIWRRMCKYFNNRSPEQLKTR